MSEHDSLRKIIVVLFTAGFIVGALVSSTGLAAAAASNLTITSPTDIDNSGTVDVRSAASGSASTVSITVDVASAGNSATFTFDNDQDATTVGDQGIDGSAGNVTITDGGGSDTDGSADGTITASFTVDGGTVTLSEGTIDLIVTEGATQSTTPDDSVTLTVDNTAPTISTVTTRDNGDGSGSVIEGTNSSEPAADNGQLDQLEIAFSEEINDSSVTLGDFTVNDGYSIDSIKTGSTGNDSTIVVELQEKSTADTGTTPTIDLSGGNLADEAGNTFSAVTGQSSTDGAAPAMISAATYDTDIDAQVDQINVTMSESLSDTASTFDSTTFSSIDTYTIGTATTGDTADDNTVVVGVSGTPSDNTSLTMANLDLASGKLSDGSNSLGSTQTLSSVADGAAPAMTAAETADTDTDGQVDQINVTLSESLSDTDSTLDSTTFASIDTYTIGSAATGDTTDDDAVTVGVSGTPTDNTSITASNLKLNSGKLNDSSNSLASSQTLGSVTDGAAPIINSITTTNPSTKNVNVTIKTGEQLGGSASDIAVSISGAETASLDRDDFTESGTGPYTYEAQYTGSSDGTYTATLDTANDSAGNDGADGESDSVTVDTSTSTTSSSSSSSSTPDLQYGGSSAGRQESKTINVNTDSGTSSVQFSDGSSVESITFQSTSVSGSVTTREFSSTPDGVTPAPGRSVSITEIAVPDGAADTPATIRKRIPADRLAEIDAQAAELQINRYNDDTTQWEPLPTEIVSQNGERVIISGETPGFSLFAVSTVDEDSSTDGGTETDTDTDTDENTTEEQPTETDEGLPGFGVTAALVALAAIALLGRKQQ